MSASASQAIPLARGCIEDLRLEAGWLHIAGWMFRVDEPLDEVLVALVAAADLESERDAFAAADGRIARQARERADSLARPLAEDSSEPVDVPAAGLPSDRIEHLERAVLGAATRIERPDVGDTYPALSEARRSGFFGSFQLPPGVASAWNTVIVLGRRGGATVTRFELTLPAELAILGPTPEAVLMHRVAHIVEPRLFRFDGLRTAHDIVAALARHGALSRTHTGDPRRLLDWGSGSARVTCVLRERLRNWSIVGCDIDAQAVAWCRANVPGIAFDVITPEPRLPYADRAFDVVIGLSVFTHLTRDEQAAWAREIQRVLVPGGLFLPTTHGATATRLMGTAAIRAELEAHGVSDSTVDATLDGVLPSGAYRATFQTLAWSRPRFEQHFEVLEASDAGVAGFQDLWVLRRRE